MIMRLTTSMPTVGTVLKSELTKEYHEYKNQKSATSKPTNEIKPTNNNQPTTNSTAASDAYLLALNLSRLLMRPVYLPICRPLQTKLEEACVTAC